MTFSARVDFLRHYVVRLVHVKEKVFLKSRIIFDMKFCKSEN